MIGWQTHDHRLAFPHEEKRVMRVCSSSGVEKMCNKLCV